MQSIIVNHLNPQSTSASRRIRIDFISLKSFSPRSIPNLTRWVIQPCALNVNNTLLLGRIKDKMILLTKLYI